MRRPWKVKLRVCSLCAEPPQDGKRLCRRCGSAIAAAEFYVRLAGTGASS